MKTRTTLLATALVLALALVGSAQCLWNGGLPLNDAELRINGDLPQVVDPANHIVMLNVADDLTLRIDSVYNMGIILLASGATACNTYPAAAFVNQQVDVPLNVVLDGINPTSGFGSPVFNALAITPFLITVATGVTTAPIAFQAAYFTPIGGPLPIQLTAAGEVNFSTTAVTNYDDLGDDDARFHGLIVTPGGIDPLCVATFSGFWIGSNGMLTFNVGSGDFTPTTAELFAGFQPGPTPPGSANPGIALLWSDLNRGGGPAVGGPNGPVVVAENTITGDVTVTYQTQSYWSSQDPAGTTSILFKPTGGFIIDNSLVIPGATSTESVVVGWSDGDDQIGSDVDFTGLGGFAGLIGPGYLSPAPNESLAEQRPSTQSLGFSTIDVTPIGPAQYVVVVL